MQVLIVNPQPDWAQRIQVRLRAAGARATVASDWSHATAMLEAAWPDILIVEQRVLEKEAVALSAALREGERLPLIVPTAFAHLNADVEQLSLRGEDALRRLEMLIVRLLGIFQSPAQQTIRVGKLTIDPARKQVVFAAKRVPLPPNQFRLLLYLAVNADRVVGQRELVREVWGYAGSEAEARELVKTHVRLIRRRLGWTDEQNNYLQNVRGFGYMLSPPPREQEPKAQQKTSAETQPEDAKGKAAA